MRKLDDAEVRTIQLQILEQVARFCEEKNIHYWLDYGTLLGAIRHKGYIPWDDDIDIGMLRPDYERFMELFNKENERYRFLCPEKDEDYYYSFGKVIDTETVLYEPDIHGSKLALNIDVFAYDNAPDEKTAIRMYKKVRWLLLFNMLQHNLISDMGKWYRKLAKRVMCIILKPFPRNYFVKKVAADAKRYNSLDSDKIGLFSWSDRLLCEKAVVSSFTDVEFEKKLFKAPAQYDLWLTKLYGNYMELPPEEERVTHHIYEAYGKL